MKCPFGYDSHPATWRCFVVFAAAVVIEMVPETWPLWVSKPAMKIIEWVDIPATPTPEHSK